MGQVAVTINGRIHRFACGDGQEARVSELSAYIQGKLNVLGHELGRIGDERLLLMATLLIADELFEARDDRAASVVNVPPRPDRSHRHPDELRASLPPKPRQRKANPNTVGLKAVENDSITLNHEPLIIEPGIETSAETKEN
jgi:cell division protein ZapA